MSNRLPAVPASIGGSIGQCLRSIVNRLNSEGFVQVRGGQTVPAIVGANSLVSVLNTSNQGNSQTTLFSYVVPGYTLSSTSRALELVASGSCSPSPSHATVQLFWAGTYYPMLSNATNGNWEIQALIVPSNNTHQIVRAKMLSTYSRPVFFQGSDVNASALSDQTLAVTGWDSAVGDASGNVSLNLVKLNALVY